MNRLNIFHFFLIVFLLAGCDNGKLTAECITDEDGEHGRMKQNGSIKRAKKISKTEKVSTIPLTDYSITDTTINYSGTTLVYWFSSNVISKYSKELIGKFGRQYYFLANDQMLCFEVTREKELRNHGVRFIELSNMYSTITIKNGRHNKHLVLNGLMYKPGLIVLKKNNNPVFYPLMKYGCEDTLLETGYLKLRPE
jgi:hypothetical protein